MEFFHYLGKLRTRSDDLLFTSALIEYIRVFQTLCLTERCKRLIIGNPHIFIFNKYFKHFLSPISKMRCKKIYVYFPNCHVQCILHVDAFLNLQSPVSLNEFSFVPCGQYNKGFITMWFSQSFAQLHAWVSSF